MVGELSQEFLRSQRAAKLAEKMCQCYDLCQALVYGNHLVHRFRQKSAPHPVDTFPAGYSVKRSRVKRLTVGHHHNQCSTGITIMVVCTVWGRKEY